MLLEARLKGYEHILLAGPDGAIITNIDIGPTLLASALAGGLASGILSRKRL